MIGTGRNDPRRWVQAAYLITAAIRDGDARDPLPSKPEVMSELGVSASTVERAYRELEAMGLVRRVPGLGYFPGAGQ
jgi:DNA-binding GntR family transcriptional regulator